MMKFTFSKKQRLIATISISFVFFIAEIAGMFNTPYPGLP